MKRIRTFFLILVCIFFYSTSFSQQTSSTHDSIMSWIEKAKDTKLSLEKRKNLLDKAYLHANEEKNDSLKIKYYYSLTIRFKSINDTTMLKKANKTTLILAKKLNDSNKIARCYWRYGDFHYGKRERDSAFFYYDKSSKVFHTINQYIYSVRMLLNIAKIQVEVKNYTKSELACVKAIKLLKKTDDNHRLYDCYNNLGIIYNNFKDYKTSIEYYNKALNYIKPRKNKKKEAMCINNIGVVHKNLGLYKKAINYYKKVLNIENLQNEYPKQYAMSLDNLAYSKLKLHDYTNLPDLFYKSLKIRDSINHVDGIIINKIHLAEYYLAQKDTSKSYQFVKEANAFAIEKKAPAHLLQTYDLLAKVDPKNSSKYLRRYIEISDSTLLEERRIQNRFARIELETDELEEKYTQTQQEAQKLGSEAEKYKRRNRNVYRILWWIGGIVLLLLIFGIARYYQRSLRNKYEKVVLQQQLLRSQMNPHFLFNTLNTILYTTDTKPKKTKSYILKLSRLLRITLENSREEFVPLQDEINALDDYLNLQSNFSEKFDFTISIEDSLETEFNYIPPMLIQPFVENAILHGIANTKTRGDIVVSFTSKNEDLISCEIVDNGIGYSKSIKEGKSSVKEHKSISGDIVKERLAIYSKQTKSKTSLQIEDIHNEQHECIGTKVILQLPSYLI